MTEKGILYLIATPLGNLGDVSERCRTIIEEVDLLACEDTRTTGRLLHHLGINRKKAVSYHDHNKEKRTKELIAQLLNGESVGLVTDAGSPCISDPGFYLVRAAISENIAVRSIPGPSAIVSALQVSGLPTNRFAFFGFIPPKGKRRKDFLDAVSDEYSTVIVYESPHRIIRTLCDLESALGNRDVCLCREMTKIHEEHLRGSISEVSALLEKRVKIKGEITLVISGKKENLQIKSTEEKQNKKRA